MELKTCPKCKISKPLDRYHKNKSSKDGLQYHCKDCRSLIDARPEKRAQDRKRYHNNREGYLNSYYKRVYNISLKEYEELLRLQNNACAICKDICISGRRLAVDHCHTTGKIRGLLCANCNRGLGLFKDNTTIIYNLYEYINHAV